MYKSQNMKRLVIIYLYNETLYKLSFYINSETLYMGWLASNFLINCQNNLTIVYTNSNDVLCLQNQPYCKATGNRRHF